VHVSAVTKPRSYLDETAWLDALADAHDLEVIVGTVDPALSEKEIVADLERQARSPRFRSVRVLYDLGPDSPAARVVLDWLDD
jgi:L-fuconolactonase